MRYLLDAHTLIWAISDPQQLSEPVVRIIEQSDNDIWVSVISFWEIALKQAMGRLKLEGLFPEDFFEAAITMSFRLEELDGDTLRP